jgi:AcrR family transcriptional regulator
VGSVSTRRPGEAAFATRAQIIDAAEALARREGLESVSVRRLSAELSLTPAALYWHLASKQELVSELVDRASARVERPERERGTWLDRLVLFHASVRDVFIEYPGISAALMTLEPTEATLANCLYVFQLLVEGGFDEDAAVLVFNALSTFASGHLMMIDAARFQRRDGGRATFTPTAKRLLDLLGDRPEFAAFMRWLVGFDDSKSRAQFLAGVELLVRGAAATAGVPQAAGLAPSVLGGTGCA